MDSGTFEPSTQEEVEIGILFHVLACLNDGKPPPPIEDPSEGWKYFAKISDPVKGLSLKTFNSQLRLFASGFLNEYEGDVSEFISTFLQSLVGSSVNVSSKSKKITKKIFNQFLDSIPIIGNSLFRLFGSQL
jgi:hypothetical protein